VMGNVTCSRLVNSLYKTSFPIAEVLRPLSETCSYIPVIDRHVPETGMLKVYEAAESWYGISCHRCDMNLEKAPGKRYSSVRNRLEQGCTNFGYQDARAELINC